MVKTNEDILVICPESRTCSQIGCRHLVLHKLTDSCSKPERGNILNGCKSPCRREEGGERCGAYAEHWEELGKPKGWLGCSLPRGHEGDHRDD